MRLSYIESTEKEGILVATVVTTEEERLKLNMVIITPAISSSS